MCGRLQDLPRVRPPVSEVIIAVCQDWRDETSCLGLQESIVICVEAAKENPLEMTEAKMGELRAKLKAAVEGAAKEAGTKVILFTNVS